LITNMKDAFSVKGKNVLVTGGSRGVGLGIVQAFAQSGANVAIMARDEKAAQKVLADISSYGGKYLFFQGDVVKKEDCERVVNSVKKEFGSLDILVNNAGICRHTRTLDMGPDFKDWYEVIDVNLNGYFLMCYYAAEIMKEQGGGSIINITSIAAEAVLVPQWQCSYNSSKAAANHLVESLALEWAPYNIRVNAIEPGYTETEMLDIEKTERSVEWYNCWKKACPTGRFLTPIEVGALCVYLGSEASEYCMGSVFLIDGGYILPR
jgi:NAD(P)-dependent dehydrogenase (short-subunit alcohol dehydrogenase family)